MFEHTLFIFVTFVYSWFLGPRVFRYFDGVGVRKRLLTRTRTTHYDKNDRTYVFSPDVFFTSLARSLRSHVHVRDALIEHQHLLPQSTAWRTWRHQLSTNIEFTELVQQLHQTHDLVGTSLFLAATDHSFSPDALDQAGYLLRSQEHTAQAIQTATAQSRISMRILTAVPLFVLTVAVITSSSVRNVITNSAGAVLLLSGVILNLIGSRWSNHVVRVASTQSPSSVTELIDATSVSLAAGYSLSDACARWQYVNQFGAQLAQQIHNGATVSEVLVPLLDSEDSLESVFAHTLISAQRDGLPLRQSIHVLARESRIARRSDQAARIQELPSKLAFPLVLCVLPSFALLVLAPLLLSNMARFGTVLPFATT